jgi:TIR domain-containing protein
MPSILLSYRRADTRWITGRIFDRLERHYGRDHVFMDIDAIPFGLDFRKHIRKILQKCDIMLAIIGPSWLALDEAGRSRLLDETDWVRIEIEAALAKDIPVIPIRVDDAILPHPQLLPESIREIVFRQAAELDAGRDFHAHMDRLIRSMDQLLAELERNPDAKAELPVAEAVALSAPAETLPAPSHEAPPLGVLVPPRAGVEAITVAVAAAKPSERQIEPPVAKSDAPLVVAQSRPRRASVMLLVGTLCGLVVLVIAFLSWQSRREVSNTEQTRPWVDTGYQEPEAAPDYPWTDASGYTYTPTERARLIELGKLKPITGSSAKASVSSPPQQPDPVAAPQQSADADYPWVDGNGYTYTPTERARLIELGKLKPIGAR